MRNRIAVLVVLAFGLIAAWLSLGRRWDRTPESTLRSAIEAHGGHAAIDKTRIGRVRFKVTAKSKNHPMVEVDCVESFVLPGRYHRVVTERTQDRNGHWEYAVVDGKGWQKRGKDGDDPNHIERIVDGRQLIENAWNGMLAMLPSFESDGQGVALGREQIEGREAVGVDFLREGEPYRLYFDADTRLLLKVQGRMNHQLLQDRGLGAVPVEVYYTDYRKALGVMYPHDIKVVALRVEVAFAIESIELLESLPDSLFASPSEVLR